jgi:predicted PurR-regulated permease PerM
MSDSKSRNIWNKLNNSMLVRFLLLFACGWVIVQLLDYFQTVIVVFSFAAVLAFLLHFPVDFLRRFLPRSIAIIITFLISIMTIAVLIIAIGLTISSQGQQLIAGTTSYSNSLIRSIQQLEDFLKPYNLKIDFSIVEDQIRNASASIFSISLTILQSILTNFVTFIFIAVISFFMLVYGEILWTFMIKIVPQDQRQNFTDIIRRSFLGFFRGQLILVLFLTVSTFIIFLILQVPSALFLSLIIGILDIIPGIGATLGVGIVTLIVLTQNGWLALQVLISCVILQQIQDNLISPRVMQGTMKLNPVVVFFFLLVGAKIAGAFGIFMAIPIAAITVDLLEIEEFKS